MNQKPIFVNRNFLECCGYPAYLKTGYLGKFSVRPDAIHPTPDNGRKLFFIPDIRHFRYLCVRTDIQLSLSCIRLDILIAISDWILDIIKRKVFRLDIWLAGYPVHSRFF